VLVTQLKGRSSDVFTMGELHHYCNINIIWLFLWWCCNIIICLI
jgi:hypothetical protein